MRFFGGIVWLKIENVGVERGLVVFGLFRDGSVLLLGYMVFVLVNVIGWKRGSGMNVLDSGL